MKRALFALLVFIGCNPNPADPTQPPCGGSPVFYGEQCCHDTGEEWKCSVEEICGYVKDDCRSLDPLESRK